MLSLAIPSTVGPERPIGRGCESSVASARPIEALSTAGVPVYAMPGRGGGWRLVGGARTDLSGLTASEARALLQKEEDGH